MEGVVGEVAVVVRHRVVEVLQEVGDHQVVEGELGVRMVVVVVQQEEPVEPVVQLELLEGLVGQPEVLVLVVGQQEVLVVLQIRIKGP